MFDALHIAASADRVALQFPDRSLTYGELDRASAALAASLAERGASRSSPRTGSRRAWRSWRRSAPACRRCRSTLARGPRSSAHIVADAAPEIVLTAPERPIAARPWRRRDITSSSSTTAQGRTPRSERADAGAGPRRPALIVYTSGPPDRPRARDAASRDRHQPRRAGGDLGVDRPGRSRPRAAAVPRPRARDRDARTAAPRRRALHLGRFDPAAVGAALAGDATMLFGVPTMYHRLAGPPSRTGACRRAGPRAAAGLRLRSAVRRRPPADAAASGQQVVQRYGMTESLIHRHPVGGARRPGTVGPPLPGVELRLVDDGGDVLQGAGRRDDRRDPSARTQPVPRLPQPTGRDRRGNATTAGSSPATWRPAAPTATCGWSGAARPT